MSSLSHVRLFVTPWTVAYEGPPSMGFSSQEYWSGFGDKILQKAESNLGSSVYVFFFFLQNFTGVGPESECDSCSVVSDSLQLHGLYGPWNSPGQNTGGGSISLFQGIFPTQGSNPGFWHSMWIIYQQSHKGSPGPIKVKGKKFYCQN